MHLKDSDANNDYIRMMLLRNIEIGDTFAWSDVLHVVNTFGRTNRNSVRRVLFTLLSYGYIAKVRDGVYIKLGNYHFKEIEYTWLDGWPSLMLKKIKLDGIVVSMEIEGKL